MPVLTITAVDHTNDLFTSAGHGLNTGDGPAVIRNITSGGALPTGAAAVTDYWIIRVDANTFKLASSSANALAGTPINLTANGSGTNILEVGIPYARARTYVARAVSVAGAQLKSADLNSMMDSLKALHRFVTGQAQSIWTDLVLAANQHVVISGTGQYKRPARVRPIPVCVAEVRSGTATKGPGYIQTGASAIIDFPLPVNEGERITAVSMRCQDTGADQLDLKIYRVDESGTTHVLTQLGSTASSTGSAGTNQTVTVSGLTEDVGTALYTYFAEVSVNGTSSGCIVNGLFLTTTVP